MKRYLCLICGLIYDEAEGWPDDGIAPGTKWADVGSCLDSFIAIKTDGTLWAWGLNDKGQLGQNANIGTTYSSPIQIPGTWNSISSGGAQSFFALKS